jgi:hypothetical protein
MLAASFMALDYPTDLMIGSTAARTFVASS